MELPKWAFKAESVVRSDASIDMVFSLRPLGRFWLYVCAVWDLVRTSTITLTIQMQERPTVTHGGERVEPKLDYELEDEEIESLVKRVPAAKLGLLIAIAKDRCRAPGNERRGRPTPRKEDFPVDPIFPSNT
jgi:hypothetical protein